jgi:pimeloyl-ACP methyl ester carboxylesterase
VGSESRELRRPDGVNLHYSVEGTGAKTVVFLHGLAGHSGEWAASAAQLNPTCVTIRLDQRGHGRSDRPRDVSRQAFRDDVVSVIEACGAVPVTIVGQSMGAHTALLVAAHRTDLVSHLVLVEGDVGGGGPSKLDEIERAFDTWPESFNTRAEVRDYFGGTTVGETWAEGFEERDGRLRSRFDPSSARSVMAPVMLQERWDAWGEVTATVDLVLAEHSAIDASRIARMCALRPATRCHVVPGAGHDLHLDQSDRWTRLLQLLVASAPA